MTGPDERPEWRVNAADRGRSAGLLLSLWHSRELVRLFAQRDLRVRYKQASLGAIWVLLQPVATVLIFTLVFRRLAGISSEGIPYPLFALVGMVVWTYFASATVRASEVLVGNPQLITKVSFPRITAPAATLLPPLVDLGVSMVLVAALMVYYRAAPTWRLLTLPLWLLMLVAAAFGLGLWLSALNVRYRDVQHAVAPVLQVWLFASPVAYPSSLLSGWQQSVYALNPMAGVIGLARWSVLSTPWPGWPLVVSLAVVITLTATGLAYFGRAQRSFADVI